MSTLNLMGFAPANPELETKTVVEALKRGYPVMFVPHGYKVGHPIPKEWGVVELSDDNECVEDYDWVQFLE